MLVVFSNVQYSFQLLRKISPQLYEVDKCHKSTWTYIGRNAKRQLSVNSIRQIHFQGQAV